jgi:hypothetical protein
MMNIHGVQMSFQRKICISGIAEAIQASQAVSPCEFLPTTINLKKARRLASKSRSSPACIDGKRIILTSAHWPNSCGTSWLYSSPEMAKAKGIAKKEAAKDKKQSFQPEGYFDRAVIHAVTNRTTLFLNILTRQTMQEARMRL